MDTTSSSHEITRLLQAHKGGDPRALDALMPLVYDYLRIIARRQAARGRAGETLSATALVHETYVQLSRDTGVADWQNRSHFFAICARTMRRIVVDHLRHRNARKRGGDLHQVTLEPHLARTETKADTLLAVDRALRTLGDFNERLVSIVECRFYVGMSEAETADALELSLRTVQRDWQRAKLWLRTALS